MCSLLNQPPLPFISQGKPLEGKPAAIAEVLRGKVEKKTEAKQRRVIDVNKQFNAKCVLISMSHHFLLDVTG